jgi:hypothetical protein
MTAQGRVKLGQEVGHLNSQSIASVLHMLYMNLQILFRDQMARGTHHFATSTLDVI